MNASDIAKIVYEATRAYNEQVFGDFSQKKWDHLTDEQKTEIVSRVTFTIEYRNAPASAYHDRWLAAKLWDGWTPADYTDSKTKKHKRLLPWSLLPKAEQARDRLFVKIVNCLVDSLEGGRLNG